MSTTRTELTEFFWDDIPSAISYWATDWDYTPSTGEGTLSINDTAEIELDTPFEMDTAGLERAIDAWADGLPADAPTYPRKFADNWAAEKYGAADYDATIIDAVIQTAVFGAVKYG